MGTISYTEDPKRLRQTVALYKMIIENPDVPLEDILKELSMSKPTGYERIYDFCTLYENTVEDEDFPEKLIKFYNRFSQAEEEKITKDEILLAGKLIVKKYHPKYRDSNNNKGDEPQEESYSEMSANSSTDRRKPPQAPNPYAYPGNYNIPSGIPEPPDMSTYEGLLQNICENVPYIQSSKIAKFLNLFAMNKMTFARQPQKLLALLKASFGAMPGELVFSQFMDAAPQFITDSGIAGFNLQQSGMGIGMGYPPGNYMGAGIGMEAANQDPQMAAYMRQQMMEQQAEERRERAMEKRMRMQQEMIQQMVQASMTNMLNRTMEAQMPKVDLQQSNDGVYRSTIEEYSPDGKVVRRRSEPIPVPMGGLIGQQQQNNGTSELTQAVIKSLGDQNNLLMTKLFSNDQVKPMENLLTSLIGNWRQNNDFFDTMAKAKQVFGDHLFGGQNQQAETPEMLRTKFDAQLALLHEQLLIEEKKHEWSAESEEKKNAAASGDKLLDTVSTTVEKVFGPAINNLSQGYAQGLLAKQQQQQQMQMEMERQASLQRQAAMAQETARRVRMAQRQTRAAAEDQTQPYDSVPRGAPRPEQVGSYNTNPYVVNSNQYNEKQFFNLSDQQLGVLDQEFTRRAIDMENFGNALRAAKAQRKLLTRQQQQQPEPSQTEEYNNMGSAVGAQAPAQTRQGSMQFDVGNTSTKDDTGTNPGPVLEQPEEEEDEEEYEEGMEKDTTMDAAEVAEALEESQAEEELEETEEGGSISSSPSMNFGVAVSPEQNHSDSEPPKD